MARPSRPTLERWTERVQKTDSCWLWTGTLRPDGYGVIRDALPRLKLIRAHRFAYEHFVGPVPDGLELRHQCHERRCVNPAHLLVGTRAENIADMFRAGRQPVRKGIPGMQNNKAKLSNAQVYAIRADRRQLRQIAETYGVSKSTIFCIRHRKTWSHLP